MRAWTLLFLLSPPAVFGCTCVSYEPVPACSALPAAEVAFRGAVIDHNGVGRRADLYRVAVKEIFKGLPADVQQIFIDPCSMSSCQTSLGEGDHLFYLGTPVGRAAEMFRHRVGDSRRILPAWEGLAELPVYWLCLCSPSRKLEENDPELSYLRSHRDEAQGWMFGKIVQNHDRLDRLTALKGVAGTTVEAKRGEQTVTTVSDVDGKYKFEGLEPGTYRLTASKQGLSSSRLIQREKGTVSVPAGGCVEANFSFETANSISGRVLKADGTPWVDARLYAGVLEDRGVRKLRWTYKDTDGLGRFTIAPVPAGQKLVVGININASPSPSAPYDPVYAPGTGELGSARVFELTEKEKVEGITLQMPPALPQAVLTVEAFWPDGTPAVGARALAQAQLREELGSLKGAEKGTHVVRLTLTPGREYEIHGDFYEWATGFSWTARAKPVKVHFAGEGQKVRLVLGPKERRY